MIISKEPINSVTDLKGRKVGTEVGSLGKYVLYAALAKYDMSLDDVTVVNVEQLNAKNAMDSNEVDAMVTYPPYSFALTIDVNSRC